MASGASLGTGAQVASGHASERRLRRRWCAAELAYLDFWAGVRPIHALCLHLQRSERALRCQMHRRGLSARVSEGWGLRQLREDLHLSPRAVWRYALQGLLRVHSARVALDAWPASRRGAHCFPFEEVARALRWRHTRVLAAAAVHGCRLMQLRFTDASVMRLYAHAAFATGRARLSPAMHAWLRRTV